MRFKNRSGFSLIEAMMAIAIIGMVLAPIFLLETNVFNAVARGAEQFNRIVISEQFLFVASQEQKADAKEFKLEKEVDRPKGTMKYTFGPVHQKSSLSKLKNMYQKRVVTSGRDAQSPEGIAFEFVYRPEQPQ